MVNLYCLSIGFFVQEIGVCYAFVEFEDILGVQNALKVWTTLWLVYYLFNLLFVCVSPPPLSNSLWVELFYLKIFIAPGLVKKTFQTIWVLDCALNGFVPFRIGFYFSIVKFKSCHILLQASPIQIAGRQVYIEERRPNSSGARGGSKCKYTSET